MKYMELPKILMVPYCLYILIILLYFLLTFYTDTDAVNERQQDRLDWLASEHL